MRQDENMPILLKTQVESADKTPVTACRARGGGLCGFRGAAGVPAESLKTGRCAAVRENRKFDQSPAQRVRSKEEMRQTWETPKRAKSRDFGRRGEKAARKQPAMDLSRDKNAEEMKWSPLEMGAAMQAHGA